MLGAVAQLGERLNGIQEVRGSNPLSSTTGNQGGTAESPSSLMTKGIFVINQSDRRHVMMAEKRSTTSTFRRRSSRSGSGSGQESGLYATHEDAGRAQSSTS